MLRDPPSWAGFQHPVVEEKRSASLKSEDSVHRGRVEPDDRPEGAVGSEAAVGEEHVDMWVEVEQFSRGLDRPHGPWDHGGTGTQMTVQLIAKMTNSGPKTTSSSPK